MAVSDGLESMPAGGQPPQTILRDDGVASRARPVASFAPWGWRDLLFLFQPQVEDPQPTVAGGDRRR